MVLIPALLVSLASLPSTPYGPADMAAWRQMLAHQCPANHIFDWMPEANKADLIDKFEASLPPIEEARIARAGDVRKSCASAEGDNANSCEAIVDVHALRATHLLDRFTTYACSQIICTEVSVCEPVHRKRH